ncbi:MAG: signal peptide peptidase SppA [Phycisphaerae bacterium]|nr:signal peptide peptidase SppA [Phycisphaerae bacterium]
MDYENNDDQGLTGRSDGSGAFPEVPSMGARASEKVIYVEKPAKKSGWRIFWRIVLVLSIMANMLMFLMLIAVSAVAFASGQDSFYVEETVVKGDKANKVVMIGLEGVITAKTSSEVCKQIKAARGDKNVKALIIRTNTPGGGVAASDQINHEITRYRNETNKPVIAFMQSVAASGGYYTSVACDTIIAEPTVITGSIGVIMQVFGMQELFEDKLGINPVTIKSGEKKDWPNMFKDMTEEQKTYLENKVIMPAYERFVKLVAKGRADVLSEAEVRILADGSIYAADEALKMKLIDEIGYIEDVIGTVKSLTGLSSVHVVEYAKPFSLANLMGAETKFGLNIDTKMIDEATTPRLQYLWQPGK